LASLNRFRIKPSDAHSKNELRANVVKHRVILSRRKNAQFVWRMEAVLNLYKELYDEHQPVICFEERPCQLLEDVRDPLPMGW
jgi:hypothetical protein